MALSFGRSIASASVLSCVLASGCDPVSVHADDGGVDTTVSSAIGSTVVCLWRGDRRAAFSPTYDDMPGKGWFSLAEGFAPLHRSFRIRGSVAIVPKASWLRGRSFPPGVGWDDMKAVLDQGWLEPMSHTETHPSLPSLSPIAIDAELEESNREIKEHTGYSVLTLAYPYGHYDDQTINEAEKFYVAARAFDHLPNPEPGEEDPFAIHSVELVTDTTAEDVDGWFDEAIDRGGWLVTTTHSLSEYADGWEPVPGEVVLHELQLGRRLIDEGTVWNEGFTTVAKYVRERNQVMPVVSAVSSREIVVTFAPFPDIDATWLDVPLTLKTAVPDGWKKVRVVQASSATVVDTRTAGGRTEVIFDALPGYEPIRLVPVDLDSE